MRGRGVWALYAICAAVIVTWVLFGRLPPVAEPQPRSPARSRAEAIARFDSLLAKDGPEVNPECHPRLIAADSGAARVIVILHGFTNCPKQFDLLADRFARLGYSVLIPRLPRHGLADRMNPDFGQLKAEELLAAGENAIDIAQGLGEEVTVMGLSSSAVLAARLVQRRTDIDRAVLLAPSFAPHGIPAPAARRLTGALLRLSNFFVWWDRKARADLPGPRQSYPRFGSRALAEVYRLGFEVLDEAGGARPAAKIVLVTSASDDAVNNDTSLELARRWRSVGAEVRTFQFPASQGVQHDMIDPEQPYERVRITYPVLEKLVSGR